MSDLVQDFRHALRIVYRYPRFAAMIVATLALGIGANTAIFSVADAMLWKPLPMKDPDRLAMVAQRRAAAPGGFIPGSAANLLDWSEQGRSFERIALLQFGTSNLTGVGEPERLETRLVTSDFFDVLGVQAAIGRTFSAADRVNDVERVAVVSDRFWRRRLGARPDAVGSLLRLDGAAHKLSGIMPPGFEFPSAADVWVPLQVTPQLRARREMTLIYGVGRLTPGASIAGARAELDTLAERFEKQFPDTNKGWRAAVVPIRDYVVSSTTSQYSLLLLGLTGLLLLIACVNVTNLHFVRSAGRVREIAVRTAVGASRGRIVRQLLVESVVLALAGGTVAVFVAVWGVDLIRGAMPADVAASLEVWRHIRVDGRAFGFALAMALACGILAGLAPALQAWSPAVQQNLKQGSGVGIHPRRQRVRSAFVGAEIALALVLLAGAGLMLRGLDRLIERERGVNPETLLTMRANLIRERYPDAAGVSRFHDSLLERVSALGGVRAAATSNAIPHSATNAAIRYFEFEGRQIPERTLCQYQAVSSDYFRALGIPIKAGRAIGAGDGAGGLPVAVVSDSFVQSFIPGEGPIGKRIKLNGANAPGPWLTIVGVVGNVVDRSTDRTPRAALYVPHTQAPQRTVHLVVRAVATPEHLTAAVRAQFTAIDPDLPVFQIKTLERLIDDDAIGARAVSACMSVFAGLAMALAALGLYGVMAFSVIERTREIGVRMTLGATEREVMASVFRRGLRVTAIGAALGLAFAVALGRYLAHLFHSVQALDVVVLVSVIALLMLVAAAALYLPARRAARLDPLAALRTE